ncbi:hypothetical protein [Notoacmeibacter sp. MSK16QG-6]|uniref:hypothetical protein n=1 Tax=Notoacmeibacter sp. MSK16QG-6 TaxID=2957982 RepID=UPI0020A228C5|nr:hypothetical protein [Notoacmeibacter sp. MSK16QG-6]MCP1200658.1 hypothetical protein [Notoacmeibacter sp. MSK16QG-6]
MKILILKAAVLALLLGSGPVVAAEEITPEKEAEIMALLASMQCEMDPADIEIEDDGYELDDVFCSDGQYDIELDAELNIVEKRAE